MLLKRGENCADVGKLGGDGKHVDAVIFRFATCLHALSFQIVWFLDLWLSAPSNRHISIYMLLREFWVSSGINCNLSRQSFHPFVFKIWCLVVVNDPPSNQADTHLPIPSIVDVNERLAARRRLENQFLYRAYQAYNKNSPAELKVSFSNYESKVCFQCNIKNPWNLEHI